MGWLSTLLLRLYAYTIVIVASAKQVANNESQSHNNRMLDPKVGIRATLSEVVGATRVPSKLWTPGDWPSAAINGSNGCHLSLARLELLHNAEGQLVGQLEQLMTRRVAELRKSKYELNLDTVEDKQAMLRHQLWLQAAERKSALLKAYNLLLKLDKKIGLTSAEFVKNPLRVHTMLTRIATVLNGIIDSIWKNNKEFPFYKEVQTQAMLAAKETGCWPTHNDYTASLSALARVAQCKQLSKLGILLTGQLLPMRMDLKQSSKVMQNASWNEGSNDNDDSDSGINDEARRDLYQLFTSGGLNAANESAWRALWDEEAWENELEWILKQEQNQQQQQQLQHALHLGEIADMMAVLHHTGFYTDVIQWARVVFWLELRRRRRQNCLLDIISLPSKRDVWRHIRPELPGAYLRMRQIALRLRNWKENEGETITGQGKKLLGILANKLPVDVANEMSTDAAYRVATFAFASFLIINVPKSIIYKFLDEIKNIFINEDDFIMGYYAMKKSVKDYVPNNKYNPVVNQNYYNYEKVCRKEYVQPSLYCIYKRPFNGWLAYKLELLNLDPLIELYHNIIFDNEIEELINYSVKRLAVSKVITKNGPRSNVFRHSEQTWTSQTEPRCTLNLDARLSVITGLNVTERLETAQTYQILNYGNGGMYIHHYDFLCYEDTKNCKFGERNDRLATWIFYLSEPELGGETVMLPSQITIKAIKGSAILWYNIFKNGTLDKRTMHGGCPVVIGSKWIANKWIYEYENMFTRKCSLNQNE